MMIRGLLARLQRGSVSFRGDLDSGLHFCDLGAKPHTYGFGSRTQHQPQEPKSKLELSGPLFQVKVSIPVLPLCGRNLCLGLTVYKLEPSFLLFMFIKCFGIIK